MSELYIDLSALWLNDNGIAAGRVPLPSDWDISTYECNIYNLTLVEATQTGERWHFASEEDKAKFIMQYM